MSSTLVYTNKEEEEEEASSLSEDDQEPHKNRNTHSIRYLLNF